MEHRVADPGPLGLAGFAMTTFLLSIFNIGLFKFGGTGSAAVSGAISLAFIYGGVAQFAAGMWEFVRKNTFGAVAFTSYGAFWIGVYFFINFQGGLAVKGASRPVSPALDPLHGVHDCRRHEDERRGLVGLRRTDVGLLVPHHRSVGRWHTNMTKIGGWIGVVTALLAWYASAAGVINETHGKVVLPVGPLG